MDDVDFYLKVSETFSEIMRQVRFYPYPAVLYKIVFNKFLNGDSQQPLSPASQSSSPNREQKAPKSKVTPL
jgi:hypothetical protein